MPRKSDESPEERREQAEQLVEARAATKRVSRKRTFYEVCKKISSEHQCARYRGRIVDSFSAGAFVKVYEALNADNQEKLAQVAELNPGKAMSIVWKLVK